jgi:hypothetical protein
MARASEENPSMPRREPPRSLSRRTARRARRSAGRRRRPPRDIAADARLMAAAPLLLAALRVLIVLTRRHFGAGRGCRPDRRVMLNACAAATAIIIGIDATD